LSKRKIALIKVLITAMLWGTTYVLVSMGLEEMGPMMLAGIRYTLAGLILLPVLKRNHLELREYKAYFWQLAALGVFSFTIGNGFVGFALEHLSSTSVSLLSNLSAPLIMIAGMAFLKESPAPIQILGVLVVFGGMALYFNPREFAEFNIGYLFMVISLLSFTAYNLLGRYLARSGAMPFLIQTTIPFIVGGGILLILAFIFEGMPVFTLKALLIILFMALFNSITGYILYNQALADLTAIEVNIILKLSPFFTAFYAWLLLGERITPLQILAMLIAFAGIYLVQRGPSLGQRKEKPSTSS
jgi:drug/metabolite transporter (DMT)-like permease